MRVATRSVGMNLAQPFKGINILDESRTPEALANFSPGQRPGSKSQLRFQNSVRVGEYNAFSRSTGFNTTSPMSGIELANSFRVRRQFTFRFPGRCPGLKFANAFGVLPARHE